MSNSWLTKPTDTAFNWKLYRQPNALNKEVWQKGGSSLNTVLAGVSWEQLSPGQSCKHRKEKENNPKLPGLLKHESMHDHYDLIFKSYIEVNKNNNKIRQQLQRNDKFLAGKCQDFISTRLFQRHFKLSCVVVVDFYVQKKN